LGLCVAHAAHGQRRITVSTSGVVPLIEQLGADLGVNLAISLHAVTNALRDRLVPLNKTYPLEALLDACRYRRLIAPSQ
jgi:23S rRNA (adenine2503-C2)-methyltransferase